MPQSWEVPPPPRHAHFPHVLPLLCGFNSLSPTPPPPTHTELPSVMYFITSYIRPFVHLLPDKSQKHKKKIPACNLNGDRLLILVRIVIRRENLFLGQVEHSCAVIWAWFECAEEIKRMQKGGMRNSEYFHCPARYERVYESNSFTGVFSQEMWWLRTWADSHLEWLAVNCVTVHALLRLHKLTFRLKESLR